MKTEKELNALKEEVETLNGKLSELSEDELEDVTGGGCLDKLSSGAQVNSYRDDPDDYQISERMRP